MNKLLTVLCLFGGIILCTFANGQAESKDKKVWISIGADAAKLIEQQYQGFINLHNIERVTSAVSSTTTIAQLSESQIDRLSEFMHDKYNRCGGFFYHESLAEAQTYTKAQQQIVPMANINYSIDNATTVDTLLTHLTASNLTATIDSLASYHNRYYSQQTGADAATWLKNKWSSMASQRADISVDFFQHSWKQPSVIATINGTTNNEEIVIIGGHLDSINGGNPTSGRAPGADDNASGIAVITETLRTLIETGFKPERTIKIIAYAAEEVGLRGSKEIAQRYKAAGKSIVGVVQFDMTANKGSADKDIVFMTDYTNDGQNQFLVQLIETYLPNISYGFDQCGYGCSDHASWHNEGYATSMPFESRMNDINGKIHTDNDSSYNINHIVNFAKLSMSYVGELAKGNADTTDNPTGELQNGVAKRAISGTRKQQLFYSLDVPANATDLRFTTSGGTGDADLYVKFGSRPSLSAQDCKSTSGGNTETCTLSNVQVGTYHVMVEAWSAISGVSLTGTYTDGGSTGGNDPINDNLHNISVSKGQWQHYTQTLPAGYSSMTVNISGGVGDADLYIHHGAQSTSTVYDCRPYLDGNTESCSFTAPAAGTWYIDVYGYQAVSALTLTIQATP